LEVAMKAFVAVISGFLLSAPVAAHMSDGTSGNASETQASAPEGAETGTARAEAETAADPNRRVCRRVETNTGSRVPFRTICLTERQWRTYRPN
jgi:hypothetical protein